MGEEGGVPAPVGACRRAVAARLARPACSPLPAPLCPPPLCVPSLALSTHALQVEKVPDSTYDMVGGLDQQIKEIKEVRLVPLAGGGDGGMGCALYAWLAEGMVDWLGGGGASRTMLQRPPLPPAWSPLRTCWSSPKCFGQRTGGQCGMHCQLLVAAAAAAGTASCHGPALRGGVHRSESAWVLASPRR